VLIYTGRTVHIVPGEHGAWNVVDLQRHGWAFTTKAAALDYAKRLAAANPPSQVVLFDAFGRTETVAHYQLPQYQVPPVSERNGSALFEATVKALVIGGLVTAGISVLSDLADRVERDLKKESARSRSAHRRKRRLQAA
jgi:hypothetical protein